MLEIRDLSFSYGSIQTLRGINMSMTKGRMVCVMGRNGVGKTTLMKNIMGMLQSSSGSIVLDGLDLTGLPTNRRAQAGLSLVPQGRQIFPELTVEENLKIGLQARTDGCQTIPDEIYELFPILKETAKRMGGDLSGGMQQQLAIGRALIGQPKVLLLDEPTEGIQPNIIQQIGKVLQSLITEREMIVVLVEQYVEFVKEFGHQFYIMNRGQVVAQGETSQLTLDLVRTHLSV